MCLKHSKGNIFGNKIHAKSFQNRSKIHPKSAKIEVRRGPEGPGARSGSHGGPQRGPGAPKHRKSTFEGHFGPPIWEAIFGTFSIFLSFCGTFFLSVVLEGFRDRFRRDFGTISEGNFKDLWYKFRCTLHIAKPHFDIVFSMFQAHQCFEKSSQR